MYRSFIAAVTVSSVLALSTASAMAGGMITIKKHGDARFLRLLGTGFAIARIVQDGNGNSSALRQLGGNNVAFNGQFGNGHSSTIDQTGGGNVGGVLQFGKGASSNLRQTGGASDLVLQFGW